MLIGVDLDNTIISYDALFRLLAAEGGFLADDGVMSKKEVRDTMWTMENGNRHWTDIQALAYGPRIGEAEPFPGALAFFEFCGRHGIETCIVSHKTEFAASDPDRTCNLCDAAMGWLHEQGFFSSATSLTPDRVHFAGTRADKVAIISELGCDLFVDDLIEVFEEPGYPESAEQVLFALKVETVPERFGGEVCTHWDQMTARLAGNVLGRGLQAAVERALDAEITLSATVGGGRNSRVYRIETVDGPYALKHYHDRHRLDAEFAAFAFLQMQGVAHVPAPVAVDRNDRFAVYDFLEGEAVTGPDESDIDACVEFVRILKAVSVTPGASGFGPAAEGFFRLSDIVGNLRNRLVRLDGRDRESAVEDDLAAFLEREFSPVLETNIGRARAVYADLGLDATQELSAACRILSPSDFGFHNAVRTPDGLAFLDFEYFGWDDPAKLISEFLLHPGMEASWELRVRFGSGVVGIMNDPHLESRLGALLPLFALKWCMILLNEFLRTDFDRRRFAGATEDRTVVLRAQLVKARTMLGRATDLSKQQTVLNGKG